VRALACMRRRKGLVAGAAPKGAVSCNPLLSGPEIPTLGRSATGDHEDVGRLPAGEELLQVRDGPSSASPQD
jgi:hypothetical protein